LRAIVQRHVPAVKINHLGLRAQMSVIKSGFQLHSLSLHIFSGVKEIIPGWKGDARGRVASPESVLKGS